MKEIALSIMLPQEFALQGETAGSHLFGGNVLAPRTEMTGPGSYDEAIEDLNVTGLRYPGGSLTEWYFDLSNPDADIATHADTGETTPFVPLSEFMGYAEAEGHAVTIVIPTRFELSAEVDENGDRLPDIDEDELREFIHDVASGSYGSADIRGFEIGNEYWGSGQMNAVEYGRLASKMSTIISDELDLVSEIYEIDTSSMSVLTQMGHNYGTSRISDQYDGWSSDDILDDLSTRYPDAKFSADHLFQDGSVNWTAVNNELIKMSFDTDQEISSIDGIIAHVYTRGTDFSRQFDLDMIQKTWLSDEALEELEIHVTEWNLKSSDDLDRHDNYGLYQAHDMLNTIEEFMAAGVDQAHVWPLIQNTSNPLCVGFDYSESTAAGKMFSMMSENIPGKTMLDFTPKGDRQTELRTEDVDIHAFASQDDIVLYLASTSDESKITDIDVSSLIAGSSEIEVQVLGVCEGEQAGSSYSSSEITPRSGQEVFREGIIEADLKPGEIMQVVIKDFTPSEAFASVLDIILPAEDTILPEDPSSFSESDPAFTSDIEAETERESPHDIPMAEPVNEEQAESRDEEPDESSDDWGGLSIIVGLLPLLALFGVA